MTAALLKIKAELEALRTEADELPEEHAYRLRYLVKRFQTQIDDFEKGLVG